MNYIQRRFYLPEDMYAKLSFLAKQSEKSTTQLLREFVEEGVIKYGAKNKPKAIKGLLAIAKMAEKEKWSGPTDLALNHDKYFIQADKKFKRR